MSSSSILSTDIIHPEQIERALLNRICDLEDKLCYLFMFPHRAEVQDWSEVEISAQLDHVRWLLKYWAAPVEIIPELREHNNVLAA